MLKSTTYQFKNAPHSQPLLAKPSWSRVVDVDAERRLVVRLGANAITDAR